MANEETVMIKSLTMSFKVFVFLAFSVECISNHYIKNIKDNLLVLNFKNM